MARNSQYILDQEYKNSNLDTKRLVSYWKLQFLFQNVLKNIDKTLDNIPANQVSTPTDLAIKEYVKFASSNILYVKQNLGEIENYYGVYSGSRYEGLNAFVKTNNTLKPVIVTDNSNPLIVDINNKEYSFTNIIVDSISTSSLHSAMSVTLTSNSKFGKEESKYLTELPYTSITKYGNATHFIIKINDEYSTVRVENNKLYFEHIGGATRSQWRISNNRIADVAIIPSNNLTFQLLDIVYLYINTTGKVIHCFTEPKAVLDKNELLSCSESTYGYNIIDEQWYYFDKSTNTVTKQDIQLIGMVGVDNSTVRCAYSLPCYLKKSQKNTIKLQKVNNRRISSVSGDNVLYFNSKVLHTRNAIFNWNLDATSYKNTTVFLYLDEDGNEKMSLNRPYKSEYGGYYLNNRNWRCVGSVFVNSGGIASDPCDLNGTLNFSERYNNATFARFPLGFEGQIKVIKGTNTQTYNVKDLNCGISVEANTTIEYYGVING